MGKVIYLIGAGASFNSIPTVEHIPSKLREYVTEMEAFLNENVSDSGDIDFKRKFDKYKKAIFEVAERSGPQSTIDTYAKQLLLTRDSTKYLQLKGVLTSYFNYLHFKNPADSRYDSFLASILGETPMDFKGNINIISWNYDFQIEKAYSRFHPRVAIKMLQVFMQVFPASGVTKHDFYVFKINGSVDFLKSGETMHTFMVDSFVDDADEVKLIKRAVNLYENIASGDSVSNAMFSFENSFRSNKEQILSAVKTRVKNSDALVVIGYSFPYFNRETDRFLLEAINKDELKVYIQDPKPERIEDSFLSIAPKSHNWKVKRINSCDQFFLPPEL